MLPLLQLEEHCGVPLGAHSRLGPGWTVQGSVHSWVGDTSLRKGLIVTDRFRGKPCRVNKIGYDDIKRFWGLTRGGVLLLFWWSELQTAGFSFPIRERSVLGQILSPKGRCVNNQTEPCPRGKVEREMDEVTRLHTADDTTGTVAWNQVGSQSDKCLAQLGYKDWETKILSKHLGVGFGGQEGKEAG